MLPQSSFNLDFSKYARPICKEEMDKLHETGEIEMNVMDIEMSMGAPNATVMHEGNEEEGLPPGAASQPVVPIVRLYGLTREGMSIRANIYGWFPCMYVLCRPFQNSDDFLDEIQKALESELEEHDDKYFKYTRNKEKLKRILDASIEVCYDIGSYHPNPAPFVKFTLATGQYIDLLGNMFEAKNPNRKRLSSSTYDNIDLLSYNCFDQKVQFKIDKDISGYSWVKLSGCVKANDDPRFAARTTIEVDTPCAGLKSMPDDTTLPKGLRIMTWDLECSNTKGFPKEGDSTINCISASLDDIDGKTQKEIVFQHGLADKIQDTQDHVMHYMFHPNGVMWYDGHTPGPNGPIPEQSSLGSLDDILRVEKHLLEQFAKFVNVYDPDIIIGHNSNGFDNPYYMDRAHLLRLDFADNIGRDSPKWRPNRNCIIKRKAGNAKEFRRATIVGRFQFDTLIGFEKDVTKKERSLKLGKLAEKYLGGQTKDDVGHKLIVDFWKRSNYTRSRLAKYNRKDVTLTRGLWLSLAFVYDYIVQSNVMGLMPQELMNRGQSAKVWGLLLREAKNPHWDGNNYRANIPYEKPVERDADDKFEGAIVLPPTVGWYKGKPVGVGDFSSLYPSIIVHYNLCYSTLLLSQKAIQEVAEDKINTAPPDPEKKRIPAKFVKKEVREGLLPRQCRKLLNERNKAKALMAQAKKDGDIQKAKIYNSRQLAVKVANNSIYGFLSASGGLFVRMPIAESVTAWGRAHIMDGKGIAEGPDFGCQVIAGDTDSIMFIKDGVTDVPTMFDLLRKVCAKISDECHSDIMKMLPEKVYSPYLILKKKHYMGYLYETPDGKPKLDTKGLENARRDFCPYVTNTLDGLQKTLATTCDEEKTIEEAAEAVRKLIEHKVDLVDLIISRNLSRETYVNKQPHSDLVERMEKRDPTFKRQLGDRIPYIIINMPNHTDKISEKAEDPLVVIQEDKPIDWHFYLENQLMPSLKRMIGPLIHGTEKDVEMLIHKKVQSAVRVQAPASKQAGIGKFFMPMKNCLSCGSTFNKTQAGKFCNGCITNGKAHQKDQEMQKQIHDIEDCIKTYNNKCSACRGYDDPSIVCQQRDCRTIFDKATKQKALEQLKNKYL